MEEIAFKLKKGSPMYQRYMEQKQEQQKFHGYAREFFDKHGLSCKGYIIEERLVCDLTDEERDKYAGQILKVTYQGCSRFKLRSEMQKLWEREVVSKVDMSKTWQNSMWYWPFMEFGRYAMWDRGGTIYGYLSNADASKLSDDMERIKMSEYYRVKEEAR